ncbi:pyocin knob domain-containing protein [uncultured Ruminococcus sp.]|uniref:pyocin knob domain-containing protein n=1 Tax=uncultured Ruminococcus sp. TaxID=165186 RepID=UPI0025E17AAF|nr:pyocin knob domain-containing protein [uncultured Ruminococcus sp.]
MIEILEEDHVDLGRQKANTNFETIQVHLDSQENPHGVTAVQVGAVPVSSWGTVLAEGVDLNTVLSPGVYAAPTNAIAEACSSLPDGYTASGQAFKLIVEYTSTANFLRQTLIGRAGVLYARTYNVSSSTFGSWEKFITSTEFEALKARVSALEGTTAAVTAESEA